MTVDTSDYKVLRDFLGKNVGGNRVMRCRTREVKILGEGRSRRKDLGTEGSCQMSIDT